MKPTSLMTALVSFVLAVCVWVGVAFFSLVTDQRAKTAAQEIVQSRQASAKRDADSSTIALVSATAAGRAMLLGVVNKDALTLSNAITEAGRDAGVELTIANVTQGPGPTLPKGSLLHPASVTFSLHASGSFEKLFTFVNLLASLPAASSIDRIQFVLPTGTGEWNMNTDVRIITGSPV